MLIGFSFALVATLLNSIAGLLQSEAVRAKGPLFSHPRYLVGLAVDGLGWATTVVALRHLPVFAVQAILGGAIAVTALISRMRHGTRLRVVDRYALAACLAGIALVAAGAGTAPPVPISPSAQILLCLIAAGLVGAAVVLRHSHRVAVLSMVAGLGFGGTSLAVRAIHPSSAGLLGLTTQLPVYLLLCFWLVGLITYTRALSIGPLALVTAVYLVTEVIVPGTLGILLLGDPIRPGWTAPMVIGLLFAAAGVLVLAHSPAHLQRSPAIEPIRGS
ncbi:MAG TPA: hypothetical protein VGH89_28770 [Pseudonocardia sp.]